MKQDINHCLRMTKEDQRMIKHLCKKLGENRTAVIRRAIAHFYATELIIDKMADEMKLKS